MIVKPKTSYYYIRSSPRHAGDMLAALTDPQAAMSKLQGPGLGCNGEGFSLF